MLRCHLALGNVFLLKNVGALDQIVLPIVELAINLYFNNRNARFLKTSRTWPNDNWEGLSVKFATNAAFGPMNFRSSIFFVHRPTHFVNLSALSVSWMKLISHPLSLSLIAT